MTAVDKAADYGTYPFLNHQKEMLSDRVRMKAYYDAIFQNKHHFAGKTVLDVGIACGILSIWSAQAGARKVFAVELTKMSKHARELVKANNLENVVQVYEGSIRDITLPEKVDVIISDWMGCFLLHESLFDSVILARDLWLKPTGVMYPSHASMLMAPIRSGLVDHKKDDFDGAMLDWNVLVEYTKKNYGVDMSVLTRSFTEEQTKYHQETSLFQNLHPNQVIGKTAVVKEIDCSTASVAEIDKVSSSFDSTITSYNTRLCGFGGWFVVHFRGSKDDPAQQPIELTTAPNEQGSTHWGQQVFFFHPPIRASKGDNLRLSFTMTRSKENHRLMEVELGCRHIKCSSAGELTALDKKFYIE